MPVVSLRDRWVSQLSFTMNSDPNELRGRRRHRLMNIEILGFAGAALMVLTLGMKTMISASGVVGIASSIVQIVFALLAGITPMLINIASSSR